MIEKTQSSNTEKIKLNEVLLHCYAEKEQPSEDEKMAVEIFTNYCRTYHNNAMLSEVNEELFNKFFLYYLPKLKLNISETRIRKIFVGVYQLLEQVKSNYNLDLTDTYRLSYVNYADDTARILDLRRELIKYTGSPILSWDPLVIDFNYYKQSAKAKTKKKSWLPKKEIFEQGYFEMVDSLGNYYYLFKKINGPSAYIKLRLDKGSVNLLKHNDILHMRLKRRIFSTNWEIVEIKGCYLSQGNKYIKSQ
jgi:hypothetical protein